MQQNKVHVRLLILAGLALFLDGRGFRPACLSATFPAQLIHGPRDATTAAHAGHHSQTRSHLRPEHASAGDERASAIGVCRSVGSERRATGARLLSGVLGAPEELIREKLESGSTFVWIQRKLPPEKVQAIKALNLKGIYFQEENQRYYPKRDMAAHVLGFVDVDEKGLGGIEHEYDSLIRSKGEKIVVMADARQRWFDGGEAQRDRGTNIILTFDEKIQYIAERELAAAIEKTHAPAGTVIVQDPNTGAILALANWPKFNPNAAVDVPAEARKNRAISAIYEPGSTFKLVTLAAAFDQNLIRADEVFDCENGAVVVAGHTIHDHKKYGMLTVADILANSSDVGAIKIALRLGSPKFYDYIKGVWIWHVHSGVDLPGESRGKIRRLSTGARIRSVRSPWDKKWE